MSRDDWKQVALAWAICSLIMGLVFWWVETSPTAQIVARVVGIVAATIGGGFVLMVTAGFFWLMLEEAGLLRWRKKR